MRRVYIAGPYSGSKITDCLDNMRRGMRAGVEVLMAGFAPWVPWHDFHHQLMLQEGETLSVEDYYEYSIAWLEVSDAVLILDGWEKSKGTLAEIDMARRLKIPIFTTIEDLKAWNNSA